MPNPAEKIDLNCSVKSKQTLDFEKLPPEQRLSLGFFKVQEFVEKYGFKDKFASERTLDSLHATDEVTKSFSP